MNKALDESECVSLHSRTSIFSGVIPSSVPKPAAPKHLHQRVDTPIPKMTAALTSMTMASQLDSGVIPSSVPKVTARRAPAELTPSDAQLDSGVIPSTVPKPAPKRTATEEQLDSGVLPSTVQPPAGHKVYPSTELLLAAPPTRPPSKSPTHNRP